MSRLRALFKTIRSRFLIATAACMVAFSLLVLAHTWVTGHRYINRMLDSQARLALEFDLAVREYVAEHVRPFAEAQVVEGEFLPEGMSTSYAARNVFEKVRRRFPDWIIKFSSDNPRNPINRAGPAELEIIERFNLNPELQRWVQDVQIDGQPYRAHFSARRMTGDCLHCHGDPADAPESLISRYGGKAGFHRPLGQVIALDMAAIPLAPYRQALLRTIGVNGLFMAGALVGLSVLIQAVFNGLVGRRLARMAAHFKGSKGREPLPADLANGSRDEIATLVENFNVLCARLEESHRDLENQVRQRTAELSHSEAHLRAITESAQDAIITIDNLGAVTFWNPAAEAIFGYTAGEVLGENLHGLLAPHRYLEPHRKAFSVFQKTGHGAAVGKTLELEARHKDGHEICVALSLSAVRIAEEWHAVGIVRDITEKKRAEEQIIEAKNAAEEANRAKSEFLANMSHEIRTPMNAIIGFADLLRTEPLTDEQRQYIETIYRSGISLLEIINDILDFSKIEAGRLDVEIVDCDLGEMLEGLDSLLRPQAMQKGLRFEILQCDLLERRIRTDPTRLRQCLVNLLGNAIKFTEQGHVYLNIGLETLDEGQTFVRFDVEDTGIGIAPEHMERLFDAFAQADMSTTRRFGGTGLGLAITHRLTELLGGRLSVSSQPGRGSVFTIRLPLEPTEQNAGALDRYAMAEATLAAPPARRRFTGRVLVVEDNVANQTLARLLLERVGLEVELAGNGQEGVDKTSGSSFDLVLMDMQMPLMNGYAATTELRRRGLTVPIIAVTAHALKDDRNKCLQAGCTAYLPKPLTAKMLYDLIEQYLSPEEACAEDRPA
ncbi:MAG TPA: DUF3365 domain-containing protein [Phycisphaerales bacterium]|nr:DUF3365 domain-containing protein [Phycisphaerales bacterium]